MKDNNEKPNQEYQYPDEEYVVEGEAHPANEQPTGLPQPNVNLLLDLWHANKRIIIISVAAIFIALLFKLFTGHKAQPVTAPVVVQPVQQENSLAVESQVNSQVQSALNASSQNKSAVDELRTEVQQLKAAVDSINSSQAQFSNTLGVLSDQINQIQESLQPKKAAVQKAPPVIPISYSLRAIIPGRAWIQGSDGSSASVAVGDMVKQYGVVQNVNAETGVVTTSSGKAITFNSDDS